MIAQMYTVEEVAAAVKLDPQYIRKEIKNEHLEAIRFGREIRISEDAIQAYLESLSTFPAAMRQAIKEGAKI